MQCMPTTYNTDKAIHQLQCIASNLGPYSKGHLQWDQQLENRGHSKLHFDAKSSYSMHAMRPQTLETKRYPMRPIQTHFRDKLINIWAKLYDVLIALPL